MCTENSIRVDYVTESPNVSGEDAPIPRAVQTLAVPILRRLNSEREQLFESEPGAFRHYLSAFLSAGESVRYLLQKY